MFTTTKYTSKSVNINETLLKFHYQPLVLLAEHMRNSVQRVLGSNSCFKISKMAGVYSFTMSEHCWLEVEGNFAHILLSNSSISAWKTKLELPQNDQ